MAPSTGIVCLFMLLHHGSGVELSVDAVVETMSQGKVRSSLRGHSLISSENASSTDLTVVTFNVLRDEGRGSMPFAGARGAAMRSFFEMYKPRVQIFALQELSSGVEAVVASVLGNFERYPPANTSMPNGLGVQDVIYFDPSHAILVQGKTRPLDVAGEQSGSNYLNSLSAARFSSRSTGRQVIVCSTHLRFWGSGIPNEHRRVDMETGSKWLLENFSPSENEPIILAGDFNENKFPLSEAFEHLQVQPSFDLLKIARPPYTCPTMSKYLDADGQRQFDWMLSRKLVVQKTERVDFNFKGEYPSDHFPIMTRYRW